MTIQDAQGNLHDGTGKFAEKHLRDGEDGVIKTTPARTARETERLRDSYAIAAQMREAADNMHNRLGVALAKDELRNLFPTATRAYVRRGDDYDSAWGVAHIVDQDGQVLYNEYGVGDWQTLLPVNNLIGGIESYTHFDQIEGDEFLDEREGETDDSYAALDMTVIDNIKPPTPGAIIGIGEMPRSVQESLLYDAADETGQILIAARKAEFEYYLTEDEADVVGADDTTITKLVEKYGDRETAYDELINTDAYQSLEQDIHEVVFDRKVAGISQAIREALA